MRPPSTPTGNNGNSERTRTRGAIRTHLGRKRTGPRNRMLKHSTLDNISNITGAERHRQEDLFDRPSRKFQDLFEQAGETTLAAFDSALDKALDRFVSARGVTAEDRQRLRQVLHPRPLP